MQANDKLSIAQIARILEVTEQTVKNWVLWFEKTGGITGKELPKPVLIQAGSRMRRYYLKRDIKKFKKFQEEKAKRWGMMADFNAQRCWGAYGKDLLERKKRGLKYERKHKTAGQDGNA